MTARRERFVSRDYEVFGDDGVPEAVAAVAPAAEDPILKRARDSEVFADGDGKVIPSAEAIIERAPRRQNRRSSRDYEVFGDDGCDDLAMPTSTFPSTGARNVRPRWI